MGRGMVTSKRVGVLMGGTSTEREVSVRSGLAIYQALQEAGYNSVLIDVGKDIVNILKKEKVRIAFIALHGGTGENGAIQGILQVFGIPYTGSGVLASALAMDKDMSKKIFSFHGLPVARHKTLARDVLGKKKKKPDDSSQSSIYENIDFPLPWVVKPSAEGSSIGVNIVKEQSAFMPALEKAFSFSRKAIIEQFIAGKEIHIGVLGNRVLGGVEVRPSLEFYNYEAKYASGLTEYIIPPGIDETVYEKCKDIALQSHMALGCSGASRVDLRVDDKGIPHVLEVNTLPGMTTTSLLPKIAKSEGMTFNDLIVEILRIAIKE